MGFREPIKFSLWLEAAQGWDFADEGGVKIPHKALPAFINTPPVRSGFIRLYRGTIKGELPHEHAYFTDERGLAGIAKAFARIPGRQLVYVDVPEGIAQAGLQTGAVTDGEYKIPEEWRRQIRVLPI